MVTSLISASGVPEGSSQHLICFHWCCSFTAEPCSAPVVHRTPRSPSAKDPSLCQALWCCHCCRTLHLSLLNSALFLPAHCSSLSWSVRWLSLLTHPPHHPVWCHQQTWWWYSQTPHPDYLWWCWKEWVPPSFSGDAPLVTGCQPELNYRSAPSECPLWARSLSIFQATCRYLAGLCGRRLWETVKRFAEVC